MKTARNVLMLLLFLAAAMLPASAAEVRLELVNHTGGVLHVTIQGVDSGYYHTLELAVNKAIELRVPERVRVGLSAHDPGTNARICRYEAMHSLPSRGWRAEAVSAPGGECNLRSLRWQ